MKNINKIVTFLISIFILIYPFINFRYVYYVPDFLHQYYGSTIIDYVLFSKELFLCIFTLILLILVLIDIIKNKNIHFRFNKYIFTSIMFILGICFTYINSSNKNLVLFGTCYDYEGALAIICYIVIGIISFNYINDTKKISKVIYVLLFILILLSLVEFFYKNPLELITDYTRTNYKIHLMFYNSSYYGMFLLLILYYPLFNFIYNDKNKILNLILYGLLFILIIQICSTAAFYIVVSFSIIILIINIKKIKFKNILILLLTNILLALIINYVPDLKSYFNESVTNKIYDLNMYIITDIEIHNNEIIFSGVDSKFIIKKIEQELYFYDELYNELNCESDKNVCYIDYHNTKISVNNLYNYIEVDMGYNSKIKIVNLNNNFYILYKNKLYSELSTNYNYKYQKLYDIATGRGYIILNSIELLKKSIIYGYGPGKFIDVFNNDDYLGILNTHYSYEGYISKINNMYLKQFVSWGGISFISFIVTILFWFIDCIKRLKNGSMFFKSLFIGCISFLIAGLINDSMVSIMPMFFIFFGLSLKKDI